MLFVLQNRLESKLKDQINNIQYLIGVGSNIDPENNIKHALHLISDHVTVLKIASIWQTPAVGSQGPDYLNTAVLIESSYSLGDIKNLVLSKIENQLGRVRYEDKNADRTIDLDVIMHDGSCIDEDLWYQAHVAVPASEILPDCKNSQSGESLSQVAEELVRGSTFIRRTDLD